VKKQQQKQKQQLVFVVGVVAIIASFVGASALYKAQKGKERSVAAASNASAFQRPHSQVIGPADAKVVVTEFTDPACETCAKFSPLMKQLVSQNAGRVKVVVRYAPLHKGSDAVVKLLHASIKQGKFHETLEAMYGSQARWTVHHEAKVELLLPQLAGVGLDLEQLQRDAASPETEAAVAQDLADLKAVGVKATPEFFVNGKPLPTWGDRQLLELVASELKANY